jgi:hypothetical protein
VRAPELEKPIALGENAIPEGTTVTDVVAKPKFSDALSIAVMLAAVAEASALNVVRLAPTGTITDDGTATAGLSLVIEQELPLRGAAAVRLSVQVEAVPEERTAGTQLKLETEGREELPTAISEPIPVTPMPYPSGDEPNPLNTWTGMGEEPGFTAIVRLTFATTPGEIRSELLPETRHVFAPPVIAQVMLLWAAIAAGPTATETELT